MIQFIILILSILSSLTTAWAGQGWYLMEPPIMIAEGGIPYVGNAHPLSEWTQRDSFESLKECKVAIKINVSRAEAQWRGKGPAAETNISQAASAQCIASDDPRLKP